MIQWTINYAVMYKMYNYKIKKKQKLFAKTIKML